MRKRRSFVLAMVLAACMFGSAFAGSRADEAKSMKDVENPFCGRNRRGVTETGNPLKKRIGWSP